MCQDWQLQISCHYNGHLFFLETNMIIQIIPPPPRFSIRSVNLRSEWPYRVEVPLRTSHMSHLKASAEFLYVHTEQSQVPSSMPALDRFNLHRINETNRELQVYIITRIMFNLVKKMQPVHGFVFRLKFTPGSLKSLSPLYYMHTLQCTHSAVSIHIHTASMYIFLRYTV